ncbi:hypothetical protein [Erythrobacter donghaensis]|uniref:hypothetical protein n=1 Tax=Erythrobacter donghaensis TaxID=267135 RepID=UPI000A38F5AB|nr:hypothetical protein [Erythrobacter donghaensis]
MVDDAVGEVIGGAVEVAAEVLGDIGADVAADAFAPDRRRRRGCWRLFLIVLVIAAIVGIVIAVMP